MSLGKISKLRARRFGCCRDKRGDTIIKVCLSSVISSSQVLCMMGNPVIHYTTSRNLTATFQDLCLTGTVVGTTLDVHLRTSYPRAMSTVSHRQGICRASGRLQVRFRLVALTFNVQCVSGFPILIGLLTPL